MIGTPDREELSGQSCAVFGRALRVKIGIAGDMRRRRIKPQLGMFMVGAVTLGLVVIAFYQIMPLEEDRSDGHLQKERSEIGESLLASGSPAISGRRFGLTTLR